MADKVHKRVLTDGSVRWDAIADLRDPNSGKRKQVQKTFDKERDAKKWVIEQESAVHSGTAVLPSAMTVKELLEYWLENHIKPPRRSGQTFVNYDGIIRRCILPTLANKKLQQLTVVQVQTWLTKLDQEGTGARSAELAFIVLRQALKVAERQRIVPTNITDLVDAHRYKAPEMEHWSSAEAKMFIEVAVQSRYGPCWILSLLTGLRKGELCGLRWSDVDMENRTITVRQTVGTLHGKVEIKRPKTPKSRRTVDITKAMVDILMAHKAHQNERRLALGPKWKDHDLVFPSSIGTPVNLDNADWDFNNLIEKAGVKRIRIHDARHSYATLAILSGIPVHVVSQSMGHSDVSTTLRTYAHVIHQQKRELADRMGDLLLGGGGEQASPTDRPAVSQALPLQTGDNKAV